MCLPRLRACPAALACPARSIAETPSRGRPRTLEQAAGVALRPCGPHRRSRGLPAPPRIRPAHLSWQHGAQRDDVWRNPGTPMSTSPTACTGVRTWWPRPATGAGVLIRALEPVAGLERMLAPRRCCRTRALPWSRRLAQAIGITGAGLATTWCKAAARASSTTARIRRCIRSRRRASASARAGTSVALRTCRTTCT